MSVSSTGAGTQVDTEGRGGAHRCSAGEVVAEGSWKSLKSFTRVIARMEISHEKDATCARTYILQPRPEACVRAHMALQPRRGSTALPHLGTHRHT